MVELLQKICRQFLTKLNILLLHNPAFMVASIYLRIEITKSCTIVYLKWITDKDLLYSTGTLLNVMWQPRWEGSWGKMCIYG